MTNVRSEESSYAIATGRRVFEPLAADLSREFTAPFHLITEREELNAAWLERLNPRFVFFPHWSWKIPAEIYSRWECVIFHMTDVPYGRGGSPLQNLILRGHDSTVISALRCVEDVDAGPVYGKRHLDLAGRAEEIFLRARVLIHEMIAELVRSRIEPVPQSGEVVTFARRKPAQSNITGVETLKDVYDHIRMLDADGYPAAFVETQHLMIEFKRASMDGDTVVAEARITRKKGRE